MGIQAENQDYRKNISATPFALKRPDHTICLSYDKSFITKYLE